MRQTPLATEHPDRQSSAAQDPMACVSRKICADFRPSSRNIKKNAHSAFNFEEAPSLVRILFETRWTRIPAHRAPSLLPQSATCAKQSDHA